MAVVPIKKIVSEHATHRVKVAFGRKSNRAKVDNKKKTWGELIADFSAPVVDKQYTLEEYAKLPKTERDDRKNVGYMIGCEVKGGHRKIENITSRWVGALDLDAGDSSLLDVLRNGTSPLAQFEFFVHSTRNHTHDAPRLRIFLPFETPAKSEEYGPLMRILAKMIDPEGDLTDPTCFRLAQMMYLPSICSDGEFFKLQNDGILVDPIGVLEEWGDWQNYGILPRFKKDADLLRPAGRKAEDPLQKKGVIGAFCRTYSITEAIAEFIPEVYLEGINTDGHPRYTYSTGSTANGVIIYDNDTMLYSHHATDPCGGRAINAFDMVRIHLFRDLDEEHPEGKNPASAPSYKAMWKQCSEDVGVKRELVQERLNLTAMFEDYSDAHEELKNLSGDPDNDNRLHDMGVEIPDNVDDIDPDDNAWLGNLNTTTTGAILPTLFNITTILQNDPRFKRTIQYNSFRSEVVVRKPINTKLPVLAPMLIRDKVNGDLWEERHDDYVRMLLEAPISNKRPGYALKAADRDIKSAISITADKQSFHPIHEYLERQTWDGVPRVETLFIDYLGAEDNEYIRTISRLTLVAAVTRVYEPGAKWDFVPILEGIQGKRKSTFIETLAVAWFSPLSVKFDDRKSVVEVLQGAWILEIPELSQFKRSDIEAIKDFFSTSSEKTRLSYDRRAKNFPRQAIFIGSTNNREYLLDESGNRRFWPIFCTVSHIDIALLQKNINQIWAEALAIYQNMREIKPFGRLDLSIPYGSPAHKQALLAQESRRVTSNIDMYRGTIEAWLNTPVMDDDAIGGGSEFTDLDDTRVPRVRQRTCILQIMSEALSIPTHLQTKILKDEISKAIQSIPGWSKAGPYRFKNKEYGVQKSFVRDTESTENLL